METVLTPAATSLDPARTALVVVDLTTFDADPDGGLAKVFAEDGVDLAYYWKRLAGDVLPNSARMLDAFRAAGARIVFTRVGAQFGDYGDSQPHIRDLHRRSGSLRGTRQFDVLAELVPRQGEAVVDKAGSSAFGTGNLDILLRNAGVTDVVFCGVITNACVLLSALAAWDLGYSVSIVDDACGANSEEIHASALSVAGWLGCHVVSTAQVVAGIGAGTPVQRG
ncbi:isochorismatase family cysteine hydrolase [Amycolatopsis sp.]|uniref:cysteine hydrolase family protein n=1 Tax=Amycolatopsis sp. TaxID=37632 RepID=UPI002C2FF2A0|nr:isochorismatase family cysteine hydrolase [Amycolatopsis sp.]HVV09271.1 isochorismatase family cysteine hydrolase [Amycolatopsis sp.]